jgi:hypothetical protein
MKFPPSIFLNVTYIMTVKKKKKKQNFKIRNFALSLWLFSIRL